jgi:hypothetical protein
LYDEQLKKWRASQEKMPELKEKIDAFEQQMKQKIQKGMLTKVNEKTGILVAYGASARESIVQKFEFLKGNSDDLFSIEGSKWNEHSAVLTDDDLRNSILVNHCGMWDLPPDVRVLNLQTQELRRVPVKALDCGPGCFLKDRGKVVVLGTIPPLAGIRPCEVDLRTGENRLIGDFPNAVIMWEPVLSHDGKTLAITQIGQGPLMSSRQIYLVDLARNSVRKLGEPLDVLCMNWLADDSGLIFTKGTSHGLDNLSTYDICKMDLNGNIIQIRSGYGPKLLGDGKSIVFKDKDAVWCLCDIDGKLLKAFSDRNATYSFKSLDISGKKIFGEKYSKAGDRPSVVVFDPDTGKDAPLTTLPGLWTEPVGW